MSVRGRGLRWTLCVVAAVGAVACRTPASERPAPVVEPAEEQRAPSQPDGDRPELAPPSEPAIDGHVCTIPLGPGADAAPGPAFVRVEEVGVLRIEGGRTDRILSADKLAYRAQMVVDGEGTMWIPSASPLSLWRVGDKTREVRLGRARRDGNQLHAPVVRSRSDLWVVTDDIEWSVQHFDGRRIRKRRGRRHFTGGFSDNKFNAVAADAEHVYLSCWNGLWRSGGDAWERVDPPPEASERPAPRSLFASDAGVVAEFSAGTYLRASSAWRRLETTGILRDVNRYGVAVSSTFEDRIVVGDLDSTCQVQTEPIERVTIWDAAVDASARAWVGTDYGLLLVDTNGTVARHWEPGQLPGLDDDVGSVAVVGSGPAVLPQPTAIARRTVVGRVKLSKSGRDLAGATVLACSGVGSKEDCAGGRFVRRTTTEADGRFRLDDVPVGDFTLWFTPAEGTEGCGGIFEPVPHALSITRQCGGPPTPDGSCDLGVIRACPPFEHPPPY